AAVDLADHEPGSGRVRGRRQRAGDQDERQHQRKGESSARARLETFHLISPQCSETVRGDPNTVPTGHGRAVAGPTPVRHPADSVPSRSVRVDAIVIGPSEALGPVESVQAVAGQGLVGDRYATVGAEPGRALTLIEAEVLEDVGLSGPEARRQVVVRGV